MKTILLTGAAGYIGSHVAEMLLQKNSGVSFDEMVMIDDLSSGHLEFIETLRETAKRNGRSVPSFFRISLLDSSSLHKVFLEKTPEAVFHFAAKISVAESVQKPEFYFENNVQGSKNLLAAMQTVGTKKMVFSSTAAVYGAVKDPELSQKPLKEETPLAPINPYGESKLQIENELRKASNEWGLSSVIFRYFNAAGASEWGSLGESHEPETHLIPLVLRATMSASKDSHLKVYGTDYSTRDGSCIRDYIHVADLARAHILGLGYLEQSPHAKTSVFNLGTEKGTSVLEVIHASERVTGQKVPYEVYPRRAGDSEVLVADASKAQKILGWRPISSEITNILKTAYLWEKSKSTIN